MLPINKKYKLIMNLMASKHLEKVGRGVAKGW